MVRDVYVQCTCSNEVHVHIMNNVKGCICICSNEVHVHVHYNE